MSEDDSYGTADRDAPVLRFDFERALRSVNVANVALRDVVLQLAARVVSLGDELARRLDGVEPLPDGAPTLTEAVDGGVGKTLMDIRAADYRSSVEFNLGDDKYATKATMLPCDELLPLCRARCCTLRFALSSADLDEGVIRWDYGQPYLIRQRKSDGYCVHNHPETHHCTVHEARPRACRSYDCRTDKRIWLDFDNRVVATEPADLDPAEFDLVARAKRRTVVVWRETVALTETFADDEPQRGPRPRGTAEH